MEKLMFLIRGVNGENYVEFTRRIFKTAHSLADSIHPGALKLTLTVQPPPALSVIPFKRKKIAVISVHTESPGVPAEFPKLKGFCGAFSVTEAIPVGYEKTWENGEETPGVCLLTLFQKRNDIDHATFTDRWHNGHTPLSLKLHPLWNYNRNVVNDRLTDHPCRFDGIVEEHVRKRKELLNIFHFFGKPRRVLQNMLLVYTDTKSFIEYKTMETYLAAEYHITG